MQELAHIWILQVNPNCETFLNFNENENAILKPNDFLDFINIFWTVICIVYFTLLSVINFANLYFWVVKISVPSPK